MPRFISISKDSDTLQRVKSCRSSTDSLRKSPTETVCTAAHGIHYNREREGSYGWEITHSHQTNAADCGLRSCRSHKQPNIIHRFYCSRGFNGKRNAGRHQQSLQSNLSRTVIKFYFITLLLFLSGLHRHVERQALVQSAICQKRRWHPKSLVHYYLFFSDHTRRSRSTALNIQSRKTICGYKKSTESQHQGVIEDTRVFKNLRFNPAHKNFSLATRGHHSGSLCMFNLADCYAGQLSWRNLKRN